MSDRRRWSAAALGGILSAAALACVVPEAAGEPAAPRLVSFDEFCGRVLAYYPKLKKQGADVRLALARRLQAAAGFLPFAQGLASVTTSDDPVFVFGSLLRQEAFTEADFLPSKLNHPAHYTDFSFALQGELPLFDALQTITRVRAAHERVKSARLEESSTEMEALLVAAEAYLRAVALGRLVEAAAEVRRDSTADIGQAEDLKEKGMILGADFYAARGALGTITRQHNEFVREQQGMKVLLNILMGEEPGAGLEVYGDLQDAVPAPGPPGGWIALARSLRPDLLALDGEIAAQSLEVLRERSTILPRFSAVGDVQEDTHDLRHGGNNFGMGVKGTMDLFDPAYGPRIRAARASLEKLREDRLILLDSISRDIASEQTRCATYLDNLPVVGGMKSDLQEAVSLTLPLYREGRKSIADLLEVRTAPLGAAQARVTLLSGAAASWTRLWFLSGQLDESRRARLSRWLEGKNP